MNVKMRYTRLRHDMEVSRWLRQLLKVRQSLEIIV